MGSHIIKNLCQEAERYVGHGGRWGENAPGKGWWGRQGGGIVGEGVEQERWDW